MIIKHVKEEKDKKRNLKHCIICVHGHSYRLNVASKTCFVGEESWKLNQKRILCQVIQLWSQGSTSALFIKAHNPHVAAGSLLTKSKITHPTWTSQICLWLWLSGTLRWQVVLRTTCLLKVWRFRLKLAQMSSEGCIWLVKLGAGMYEQSMLGEKWAGKPKAGRVWSPQTKDRSYISRNLKSWQIENPEDR